MMNRRRHAFLGLLLGLGALSGDEMVARSQSGGGFELTWSTIDNGGDMSSTGGAYSLRGTVGQPDAGRSSTETYTLDGGFWPVITSSASQEIPTLSIEQSGNSIMISWSAAPTGFELESSPTLAGPVWTVAPAGNPVTILVTGAARFYRLKKP